MNTCSMLAGLAATCWIGRLGLMGLLHVRNRQYSVVRHAVSDYAVGAGRTLSAVICAVSAAGWAFLAGAVWTLRPLWPERAGVGAALAVLAALAVVIVAAPTDLEGQKLTARGMAHYALAIVSFGLAYSLTGNFVRLLSQRQPDVAGLLSVLHWVAAACLAAVVITMLPRLRSVFGVTERAYLLTIAVFYLVTAAALVAA